MSHLSQHARKDNMEDKPWCMTRKYFPLLKSFIDSSQVPFLDGKTQKEYSGDFQIKQRVSMQFTLPITVHTLQGGL